MEELKFVRLSREQAKHYTQITLNMAYAMYCDGATQDAAIMLGMCEECVANFFERIGLDEDFDMFIDIDDDGKVYARYDFEVEDEEIDLDERISFSA